ncbi:DUF6225 family protein [Kitasatospora sp. NPDC094015]|uniref:DUF6225 family protein n=1 Tax=Kitasatospora sp. NPDC094015 TaxID=3155205 RepID=UPI00332BBA0E
MHSGGVPSFEGEAWTVGRLRQALAGIPDATPLVLLAEYEPGEAEEYVAVDGSLLDEAVAAGIAPQGAEFTLLCRLRDDGTAD